MEKLLQKIRNIKQDSKTENFQLIIYSQYFQIACEKNRLDCIQEILHLADRSLHDQIIHSNNKFITHSNDELPFYEAVKHNNQEIINKLIELTPDPIKLDRMIHSYNDKFFCLATETGNMPLVEKLITLTLDPIKFKKMLHSAFDGAFSLAAGNGHIQIMEKFLSLVQDPNELKNKIRESMNQAFYLAVKYNHPHIVNKLIELTPEENELKQMIHGCSEKAFITASVNGDLLTLHKLIELTPDPDEQEKMIRIDQDKVFSMAILYNKYSSYAMNSIFFLLSHIIKPNDTMYNFSLKTPTIGNRENLSLKWALLLAVQISSEQQYEQYIQKPLRQIIQKDEQFIRKLIELKNFKADFPPIKLLYSMEFAKNIFNFVLVSKTIMNYFPENVTEKILDYLTPKKISLSSEEKKDIVNAIKDSYLFKIMKKTLFSVFNISTPISSLAGKKASFVDRLLQERSTR